HYYIQLHQSLLFLPSSPTHRHAHSFPTRRSSDLAVFIPQSDGLGCTGKKAQILRPVEVIHLFIDCAVPVQEHSRASRPFLITHQDRKSTRLNSSHVSISYAVFCLKKKKRQRQFMS